MDRKAALAVAAITITRDDLRLLQTLASPYLPPDTGELADSLLGRMECAFDLHEWSEWQGSSYSQDSFRHCSKCGRKEYD